MDRKSMNDLNKLYQEYINKNINNKINNDNNLNKKIYVYIKDN